MCSKNRFLACGTLVFLISSLAASAFTEPWQLWTKKPLKTPTTLKISFSDNNETADVTVGETTKSITGSGVLNAQLAPQQTYTIQITGKGNGSAGQVTASVEVVPYSFEPLPVSPGKRRPVYRVRIEGVETTTTSLLLTSPVATASCKIVVNLDRGSRPIWLLNAEDAWSQDDDSVGINAPGDGYLPDIGPGRDPEPSHGAIRWAVGLGNLWNGQSAGMIRLTEVEITDDIYTPRRLYYTELSTDKAELDVVTSGDSLRQIRAPQTLVEIPPPTSAQQFVIKFYPPSQITGFSSGLYQISDSNNPSVVWIINNPGAVGCTLHVTSENDLPSLSMESPAAS